MPFYSGAFFFSVSGKSFRTIDNHPSEITSLMPAQRCPSSPPGLRPEAVPTLNGGLFFRSRGFDDIEFDGRGHKAGE